MLTEEVKVTCEFTRSWLPSSWNNSHAKVAHLREACSELFQKFAGKGWISKHDIKKKMLRFHTFFSFSKQEQKSTYWSCGQTAASKGMG